MLTGAFVGKGYDVQSAMKNAYWLISRSMTAQATFLTYKDLFIDLGVFFLLLLPMLFMFRAKKKNQILDEEGVDWSMESLR